MSSLNQPALIVNHNQQRRQVRLNGDYTVADIFSIRRTTRDEDPDYPTTYQDPSEGRFVLSCEKNSTKIRIDDLLNKVSLEDSEVVKFLEDVPKTITEWLLDATAMRHSNFVPAGYGWDGKFTRAEYQKRQRANLLFVPRYYAGTDIDNDWLQVVLDEICRTPKSFLTLNWNDATPIPLDRMLAMNDSFGDRTYIFIDNNGNHRMHKPKRIIGNASKHPGMKIPGDIDRIIILTKNVICDSEGNPSGCGVELLKDQLGVVTTWTV